ncbi:MAG: Gfo/Idh/MocA family oxidoreductase [Verrucomicrobiae bacterium]|nr:Gfo/Idh/MocA family oxidoreductase [Verrucomicrobiae bacterium]
MKISTRRQFLKASAVVAGGTLLNKLDVGRFAHAAETHIIKLGLIGCGGRGAGAASDALRADSNTVLVAAADVFADRIETAINVLSKEYGPRIQVPPERRFSGLNGYRSVIEASDVVLIACASRFHAQYALEAVRAKRHVFVEKPGAVDVAGVLTLLEADKLATQYGTGFLSGVTYRYHLGRREAVKRMQAGEIGQIVAIQCTYLRAPYRLVERKPEWSELEYQFRNWYHFTWLSGDDIPQSLIHNLDSALWTIGDVMPEAAYAMGGRSTHFQTSMGTSFDHHFVTYEFASGLCIYGSCRTAFGCYGVTKDIYHGTKGRCCFPAMGQPFIADLKGNVVWKADPLPPDSTPYIHQHREFLQSIRAGKPLQRAKILADSTMVAVMGQLSAYTGKRLTWKETLDSKFAFPPHGEVTMQMEPPVKPGPDGIYPVAVPGHTKLL